MVRLGNVDEGLRANDSRHQAPGNEENYCRKPDYGSSKRTLLAAATNGVEDQTKSAGTRLKVRERLLV
jgi:hypothetical protein